DEASCTQISGWAWNANSPSSTVSVDIYDGGTKITTVSAGNYRGDLVLAGIGNGYHGYSYTPIFTDGKTHTINVFYSGTTIPLSNSPQTTSSACGGTAILYQGYFDEASCTLISGWAWNANSPGSEINVDIYDGSFMIATVLASNYRGDLVLAGIGNGYHGYSYTPGFTDGKTHTINVYYSGTTTPLSNSPKTTAFACEGTSVSYEGYLDEASCTQISGWAWDAVNPSSTVSVDIYDGGTKITTVSAGNYRGDLVLAGIGNGYHGYSYTPIFTDGKTHTINVFYSGTTIPLSNSPQTTSSACGGTAILYQGYFDEASCTLISGWAWNANSPGSEINVDIYDGSFMIATVLASNYRADLLAAGIGNGYHGYSYTPGFTDGKTHT